MRRFTFAIVALAIAGHAAPQAQAQAKLLISVFVGVAPQNVSPEGFVDGVDVKGLDDSANDIRKTFDNKDWHPKDGYPGSNEHYVLASDSAKSDVVVTIAARGTSAQALGSRTTMQIYRGVIIADSVPTVGVTRWVSIVLSVGTYRKEFVAWSTNTSRFSAGAWGSDADLLGKAVVGWVLQNEPRIIELQKARGGGGKAV